MEITNYLPILYIALLIIISGMFSGSETSVTSVNRSKIHKLANKGDKKAKKQALGVWPVGCKTEIRMCFQVFGIKL